MEVSLSKSRKWTRVWLLLAPIVLASLVIAGCGSSGNSASGTNADSTDAPSTTSNELVIMLNGPLSDPFFGSMKQGADAAAKALGVNYQYVAPPNLNNFEPEYTTLIQQAIGRHPDAMVVGNFIPSAFDSLIKEATSAGIPVVVNNTGLESWEEDGAITFVGASPQQMGESDGEAAGRAGVKNLLCVNHAPVNPALGEQCDAAKKALEADGGTAETLNIPTADSENPSAVTQDIEGFLASHSEVDGIQTLGSSIAEASQAAIRNQGKEGDIIIGGSDVSTASLNSVKNGEMAWLADQQGYLQGYDSLQVAVQYARYKIHPTKPIETGGLMIEKSNVDEVLAVQEANPGLRGAR